MTFDRAQALRDVREGMATSPKSLPPKYFYDERGSELFDEITHLPEYYPTRTERALLHQHARDIVLKTTPGTLVELGAGSADKTEVLLDAMLDLARRENRGRVTYIPVDVSGDFLERSAERLRLLYPELHVSPVTADFSTDFSLPPHPEPALHAFLGSTIGNFTPTSATIFLSSVRRRMSGNDCLLLGADLRKDVDTLERAYNDSQGVTARFNLNALQVINALLGSDFDTDCFEHRAVYDPVEHRIEMHLISHGAQRVRIPGMHDVTFADGEYILTEVSYKYDRATIAALLASGGLDLMQWITDDSAMFALAVARPRS